jgi:hypothetical protein
LCHPATFALLCFEKSSYDIRRFKAGRIGEHFLIQERVSAHVFGALHIIAEARCFRPTPFAARYAELRRFAAENRQAVENDREIIIALKMMRTNQN